LIFRTEREQRYAQLKAKKTKDDQHLWHSDEEEYKRDAGEGRFGRKV
jgi:hypothetical protein